MLLFQYPCGEGFGGIVNMDRHSCLNDDGTGVQFRGDEMDGAAGFLVPGLDGAGMGIEAAVLRQGWIFIILPS